MNDRTPKTCATCGRAIEWRKKWENAWANVKHCSARCRGRRLSDLDRELENMILSLLRARRQGSTICPSEAARQVTPDADVWRRTMERTREAARRLVAGGQIVVTQGGRVVDPSRARGPIRLRLRRKFNT